MRRLFAVGLFAALLLVGCRGSQSEAPPIHPHLGMDFQERFNAQDDNPLFADNAAMRKPPTGTVPRGQLRENSALFAGRTADGEYVEQVPVAVDRAVLERGQERYDIYCAPCHGKTGDGNGIIMRGDYDYTPAPSFHIERLRQVTDGYVYDVITNGVRNMPSYAHQVPVRDRWAIVAYIRALQRSQNARPETLPESVVKRLEDETGTTVGASGDGTNGDESAQTSGTD